MRRYAKVRPGEPPPDLAEFNRDDSWLLSVSARIVVRRNGIVASAAADPDYTRWPEPEETPAVLRGLSRKP